VQQFLSSIPGYLLNVLLATLNQVLILFGPLILLAVIMHFVSTINQNLGYRLFGSRWFLNLFGWLGTAVHELGHAFFALIFMHKITGMKLFSPDPKKGTLGYVDHSWDSSNLYQTIGNFFIGIGPVLMGSIMLFFITWVLFLTTPASLTPVPITAESFSSFSSFGYMIATIGQGFTSYLGYLFTGENSNWWKLMLFFYLTFSIGASVTLSMADISGALKGFLIFLLVLAVFNAVTLWIGDFAIRSCRFISLFFSAFYILIILSILVNLLFTLLLLIFYGIKRWVLKKSKYNIDN
jgi:hypothetical protein